MGTLALIPNWSELLIAVLVGLLLFGGNLPKVARDIGKVFFQFRRTMNQLRRESGIEDAIRDMHREANQAGSFQPFQDPHAGGPETREQELEGAIEPSEEEKDSGL